MPVTWDVIGHEDALTRLSRAVEQCSPHHAYLFTGPSQVGKTTVARRFAGALLCAEANPPCGTCRHCVLLKAGNHPDYHEIGVDGEATISIAEVRELKRMLTLKPHSADIRVCLITGTQRLGIPAQNALLKVLEEPPPQTVLILTAPSPTSLLPTTVSRCEHVAFTVPSAKTLLAGLPAGEHREPAVRAASRRPGLALELLADPERLGEQQEWESWLIRLVDAGSVTRLQEAKRLAEHPRLPEVIDCWLNLHREALHGETHHSDDPLSDAATHLARLYSQAQLVENTRSLFAARSRLGYNPNALLLIESTLLKLGEHA